MKKIDLFMGCMGNGITVRNKAVMENCLLYTSDAADE